MLRSLATYRGQRALDRADDVGDADDRGRTGEPVAALGAALWGQVANWTGVHTAVGAAAASSAILMTLVQWLWPESKAQDDLRPVQVVQVPELPARPAAVMR